MDLDEIPQRVPVAASFLHRARTHDAFVPHSPIQRLLIPLKVVSRLGEPPLHLTLALRPIPHIRPDAR